MGATRLEFTADDSDLKKKSGLSWIALVRLGNNAVLEKKKENQELRNLREDAVKTHERIGKLLNLINQMQMTIYEREQERIHAEDAAKRALELLRAGE